MFAVSPRRRPGAAGFEDGTISFAAVAAARHGFALIDRLGGFAAVARHSLGLAQYLTQALESLRHGNGRPVVIVYGNAWSSALRGGGGAFCEELQGPTVAFNLLRRDGSFVGYAEVGAQSHNEAKKKQN